MEVYIIRYSNLWTWRYTTGVNQCRPKKTIEEVIDHARFKNPESTFYIEQKDGKFKKMK